METKENKSVFDTLNGINVNDKTEKKSNGKNELTYLSWVWAWSEVRKRYPSAMYEIKMFDGKPYIFDEKTGYMCFTSVTIENETHEMWLPVMDSHNEAMLAEPREVKTKFNSYTVGKCTMFDVNKTIMRCLAKNLAMFGLGLYIYAGEDLPEDEKEQATQPQVNKTQANQPQSAQAKLEQAISEQTKWELETAINAAKNAETIEQLQKLWNTDFAKFQSNGMFRTAVTLRKSQLQ